MRRLPGVPSPNERDGKAARAAGGSAFGRRREGPFGSISPNAACRPRLPAVERRRSPPRRCRLGTRETIARVVRYFFVEGSLLALLRGSRDPMLFHLVNQRGALEPELRGGPARSAHYPANRFQCLYDQSPFGVFERGGCRDWGSRGSGSGWSHCMRLCRQRVWKRPVTRKDHRAFDHVLKLADISRPGVGTEGRHRLGWNVVDRLSHPAGEHPGKARYQHWDIPPALPQRWEEDGKHVQTLVEVAAKFLPVHHLR